MGPTTQVARFEDTYAQALPQLCVAWPAAPVPDPHLVVLGTELAAELGLDPEMLRGPHGLALLTGHADTGVPTVAQAYAGHQFGGYSPRLGDGRALLVGELVDTVGRRRDLHLKGSGRTPFARGGDGKAVLGPMLREYVLGEALHALGIPTTRALAVLTTGEQVRREAGPLPGAILARVAASHLRVGTVQYVAASGAVDVLRDLADYAIARHHPQAAEADRPYLALYGAVVRAQAELVARWMQVGFVHGVMNTDNMTLSGETIDFGPCAFMDVYDPATVFSSIDHGGRYAYGNQPAAAQWDLARLGEALLPLVDEDGETAVAAVTEVLTGFAERYDTAAAEGMAAKLGLPRPDRELTADLLVLLREQAVDFTTFFRSLAKGEARHLFADPSAFDTWSTRRDALLPADPAARAAVAAGMDRVNPLYIPRNHIVEEALTAATAGDLGPVERLVDAVRQPFDERPGLEDLAAPGPVGGAPYVTFCGT